MSIFLSALAALVVTGCIVFVVLRAVEFWRALSETLRREGEVASEMQRIPKDEPASAEAEAAPSEPSARPQKAMRASAR